MTTSTRDPYTIVDEPVHDRGARFAIEPWRCVLATFTASSGVVVGWLLFNSWAMGSPHFKRDARTAAVGLLGTMAITYWLFATWGWETLAVVVAPFWALAVDVLRDEPILLGTAGLKYGVLLLSTWKLAIQYRLVMSQEPIWEVRELYDDDEHEQLSGRTVLGIAWALDTFIVGPLLTTPFWRVVIGGMAAFAAASSSWGAA